MGVGDGVGTGAQPSGLGGSSQAGGVERDSRHWEKLARFGAKAGRVNISRVWLFNFEDKLYK